MWRFRNFQQKYLTFNLFRGYKWIKVGKFPEPKITQWRRREREKERGSQRQMWWMIQRSCWGERSPFPAVNFLRVDSVHVLALPAFLQDGSLNDCGSLTLKQPTGNPLSEDNPHLASTDESQYFAFSIFILSLHELYMILCLCMTRK